MCGSAFTKFFFGFFTEYLLHAWLVMYLIVLAGLSFIITTEVIFIIYVRKDYKEFAYASEIRGMQA